MKTLTINPIQSLISGQCLTVEAFEWFDKVNGNSYFSAIIYVDNKEVARLPFQYGYGEHYLTEAAKQLEQLGYIILKHHDNGSFTPLWSYCRDNGINLHYSKHENCKKRDVTAIAKFK